MRRAGAERDQSDRATVAFAEMARLRYPWHHRQDIIAATFERCMNMTQTPQVITMRHQRGFAARGIGVMARRTVQRGVHQADIPPPRHRRRILWQETLAAVGAVEGQPVKHDAVDFDAWVACVQQVDHRPQIAMSAMIKQCVVIATDQHAGDAGLGGAGQLGDQKSPGFQIRVVIVENIPGQNQRIHRLVHGQRDDPGKAVAAGLHQPLP